MALIKYQHMWLKSLDEGAKSVRIISFHFSKAFDSVPHDILLNKIQKIPNDPYIINWMIDFLNSRKQRVKVDGVTTEFLDINRGKFR
jgi:sarcosine oxidase/L-pipecolate oxidase